MTALLTIVSAIVTYLKGNLLVRLDGYKTYLGVAALAILGVVQLIRGEFTLFAALAANAFTLFGLAHKIDKLTPPAGP